MNRRIRLVVFFCKFIIKISYRLNKTYKCNIDQLHINIDTHTHIQTQYKKAINILHIASCIQAYCYKTQSEIQYQRLQQCYYKNHGFDNKKISISKTALTKYPGFIINDCSYISHGFVKKDCSLKNPGFSFDLTFDLNITDSKLIVFIHQ